MSERAHAITYFTNEQPTKTTTRAIYKHKYTVNVPVQVQVRAEVDVTFQLKYAYNEKRIRASTYHAEA
jgi:hypothetical protein